MYLIWSYYVWFMGASNAPHCGLYSDLYMQSCNNHSLLRDSTFESIINQLEDAVPLH